jgi:uncharacterized protein (DUF1015 family)
MVDVAPLSPLRYDLRRFPAGLGGLVAPPYDVVGPEERARLAASPYNIVHLDLPEASSADASKYEAAARLLRQWQAEDALVRDQEPAFYTYEQTFRPPGGATSITRRGFLAAVRLSPFHERKVLPHERTLAGPKLDRLELYRATRACLSPGFMLYGDPAQRLSGPLETAEHLAQFTTPDGIHHALGKVVARDAIQAIQAHVADGTLLIADGHHRYETAVAYRDEVDAAHPDAPADAEHKYTLAFLVNGDDPHLAVFPTHRMVHSLPQGNGVQVRDGYPQVDFDALLTGAAAYFDVVPLTSGAPADTVLREIGSRGRTRPTFALAGPDGRVAALTLRADARLDSHSLIGREPAVLRNKDVVLLHVLVFQELLGISAEAQAAKTNLLYPQDAAAALKMLRAAGEASGTRPQLLALMNPTPVAHVRDVAEAGCVMPQKSTFFFPKVVTGLCIHTLDPRRTVPSVG